MISCFLSLVGVVLELGCLLLVLPGVFPRDLLILLS